MTTATTIIIITTTEISSNSNSSCRLLDCLNSLPPHDQHVFRSLLGHIELVRLSACCHSLRSSIRNDKALWQERYHRDFLSGAYYAKEMEFVLWCVRTDVNNPCTSDKRADLLENVDWYNTYRRRVSTENNWLYGRCKSTRINMRQYRSGVRYRSKFDNNCIFITQQDRLDGTSNHSYILEYLPHSNIRSSSNIVYNSTLSTSPNVISLDIGNEAQYYYISNDHYIAVFPKKIESDTNYNVKILTRKHGGVFTTFDVPVQYQVRAIEGNWVLLVYKQKSFYEITPICKYNVMVFDIDNSIMYPGNIDRTWNDARFYKTTNNTAIVYTARIVQNDDVDRIEWALHQFSSNNSVVQLRNGRLELPERIIPTSMYLARNPNNSHMILRLRGNFDYDLYIIHSVASNGQSHTPRNCYTTSDKYIPILLLRTGCHYFPFGSKPPKVWTDLSYNGDQILRLPNTISISNLMGDLYIFITDHNGIESQLLVDINTKEIIRKLEIPDGTWDLSGYAIAGTIYSSNERHTLVIEEYGEL